MTAKKKVLNIFLLLFVAFVFFKIATNVVYSFAFPPNHFEQKDSILSK